MPQKAEARHVGDRVHAVQRGQRRARAVQARGRVDHHAVARVVQPVLLQRGRQDAHAQRLAQDQHVARPRIRVALETAGVHQAHRRQTVDRLDGIDAVAARDRNARVLADRFAAAQDVGDDAMRQHVDRHADDGQRHDGRAAHRVYVRQRVRSRDAAEVERR
ncbi:hypothetical protein G6F23_014287 [Rhizopus arrhizus]|nr:hypothetical protein G6F23_014287 [Rhizopus arrhizus]